MASELSLACLLGRLVRFTACLSVFVSFPLFPRLCREERHALSGLQALRMDSRTLLRLSIGRAEGRGWSKRRRKKKKGSPDREGHYYIVGTWDIFASHQVHVKQLSRCLWKCSRASRVIMENGLFARPSEISIPLSSCQRRIRIIVVERGS